MFTVGKVMIAIGGIFLFFEFIGLLVSFFGASAVFTTSGIVLIGGGAFLCHKSERRKG